MGIYDLPLEELRRYRPQRQEPEGFHRFRRRTLEETAAAPMQPRFQAAEFGLQTVESFDVSFPGSGGQPIKGWLLLSAHRKGRLPCVVEHIGYGGGRGFPTTGCPGPAQATPTWSWTPVAAPTVAAPAS
jgi:cephalosporin-C deacetylase